MLRVVPYQTRYRMKAPVFPIMVREWRYGKIAHALGVATDVISSHGKHDVRWGSPRVQNLGARQPSVRGVNRPQSRKGQIIMARALAGAIETGSDEHRGVMTRAVRSCTTYKNELAALGRYPAFPGIPPAAANLKPQMGGNNGPRRSADQLLRAGSPMTPKMNGQF